MDNLLYSKDEAGSKTDSISLLPILAQKGYEVSKEKWLQICQSKMHYLGCDLLQGGKSLSFLTSSP